MSREIRGRLRDEFKGTDGYISFFFLVQTVSGLLSPIFIHYAVLKKKVSERRNSPKPNRMT